MRQSALSERLEELFDREHLPAYGELVQVSPLVQRVTATNASPFTFYGTGTYIVGGRRVAVVDPGPDDDAHVAALLRALEGRTVTHICVTHTHSDHSPASRALAAATGAPVLGFGPHPTTDSGRDGAIARSTAPRAGNERESERSGARRATETAAPGSTALGRDPGSRPVQRLAGVESLESAGTVAGGESIVDAPLAAAVGSRGAAAVEVEEPGDWEFEPDGRLGHGDVVEGDGWTLECLYTPGHISNHLCFALVEEGGVLTGDHVMGWSSTIIPPPDGNLGDYLAGLQLLIDRGGRDQTYWPTHGPAITEPGRYVRALLAHRLRRSEQILTCLRDGPATIPALVARMYTDTPKMLHPAAERSVLAHLIHLAEAGRITSDTAPDERAVSYALP